MKVMEFGMLVVSAMIVICMVALLVINIARMDWSLTVLFLLMTAISGNMLLMLIGESKED